MEISSSVTVNTCIIHYRHQEFSPWLNLLPWEQLIHRKATHRNRQVVKALFGSWHIFTRSNIVLSPLFIHVHLCAPLIPFCVVPLCLCSLLDYLPLLVPFRRLPHLDAPVMITTSVSNINVSVQLGDTTPFALGFLSACGGTAEWLFNIQYMHKQTKTGGCSSYVVISLQNEGLVLICNLSGL